MSCSITSSTTHLPFLICNILEQNIDKNYSFVMACFITIINCESFFRSEKYTRTEHCWELFICYVLVPSHHQLWIFLSKSSNILEQNIYKNYSFVMSCFITSSTANLSFQVRNILEQNIGKNYSFVMCCFITSLTVNLSFRSENILEQNIGKNYSFVMCCFITSLTVNLCFEVR